MRPLTRIQQAAIVRIHARRFHSVSVNVARALEKKGLIVFRPTLSKTGRVTHWTADLTKLGAEAYFEISKTL
jgi:hypothetical protein